jgi:hypothetical protein
VRHDRSQLTAFLAGLGLGLGVLLFVLLVGRGGDGAGRPASQGVQLLTLRDGKPVGGVKELTYDVGDKVKIRIDSDVTTLVNLHPYDITRQLAAGKSLRFDFDATLATTATMRIVNEQQLASNQAGYVPPEGIPIAEIRVESAPAVPLP